MARAPVKRRLSSPPVQPARPEGPIPDGRPRVVIEAVSPEVDGGRFPSKRSLGERVAIEADVFADGHDALACVMRYRHQSESSWTELPMAALGNDRWRAEFTAGELGRYLYTFEAWVDRFLTWRLQLAKRLAAGQDVAPELEIGAKLVEAAAGRAQGADSAALMKQAAALRSTTVASNAPLPNPLVEGGNPPGSGGPGEASSRRSPLIGRGDSP